MATPPPGSALWWDPRWSLAHTCFIAEQSLPPTAHLSHWVSQGALGKAVALGTIGKEKGTVVVLGAFSPCPAWIWNREVLRSQRSLALDGESLAFTEDRGLSAR